MRGARRYGEGNVYRRSDGRFEARVQRMGRRLSAIRHTEAEAYDALRKLQRQLEDNDPVVDQRTTVRAYLTEWLANAEDDLEPSTHATYRKYIVNHIIPAIGHYRLVRLEPEHVERMLREARNLRAKGHPKLSRSTTAQIRRILRIALSEAVRKKRLTSNAAQLARKPKADKPKHAVLNGDQARALVRAASSDPWGALYVLTIDTGLREAEILGLRWQDIDLDKRELTVAQSIQRVDGRNHFKGPKSEAGGRGIVFGPAAAALLTTHRTRQKAQRMAAPKWAKLDLVFTNADGNPLIGSTVSKRWNRFRDAAGLPKVTFHELRHSSATLLIEQGADLKRVSERLGHSSIVITSDFYTHLDRKVQKDTAAHLDDILGGAETG